MAKTQCVGNPKNVKAGRKTKSHGTYRCVRKPNSPKCKGK
jgi:hypothetical protein